MFHHNHTNTPSQKTYFNANCRIRESRAVRICPKVLLFRAVELPIVMPPPTEGVPEMPAGEQPVAPCTQPGLKLLVTLNASARISNLWPSRTLNVLDSAISKDHVPGPTRLFQPTLPYVPGAGLAKAAGSTHWVSGRPALSL